MLGVLPTLYILDCVDGTRVEVFEGDVLSVVIFIMLQSHRVNSIGDHRKDFCSASLGCAD